MPNLRNQFDKALTNIEINGQKRKRAIDAHTEIRELLQQDEQLKEWGVEPLLIGSYGRDTGIYPGKDVDVFLRFTGLDTRAEPRAVFNAVWRVIVRKYGQYGQDGGRAQQQARSVKVLFPDRDRISGGDFSVDAVPAVRHGELWAIPTKDQNRWVEGEGRWVTTGAVLFGDLSTELNQAASSPRVGDRPAYKPIVKLVPDSGDPHRRQASRGPVPGVRHIPGMAIEAGCRRRMGCTLGADAPMHCGPLWPGGDQSADGSRARHPNRPTTVERSGRAGCNHIREVGGCGKPSASHERHRRCH